MDNIKNNIKDRVNPYLNKINNHVVDNLIEEKSPRVLNTKKIGIDDVIVLESQRLRKSRAKGSEGKTMLEISIVKNGLNITNLLYDVNLSIELKDGYMLILEDDYSPDIRPILVNHIKEATQI